MIHTEFESFDVDFVDDKSDAVADSGWLSQNAVLTHEPRPRPPRKGTKAFTDDDLASYSKAAEAVASMAEECDLDASPLLGKTKMAQAVTMPALMHPSASRSFALTASLPPAKDTSSTTTCCACALLAALRGAGLTAPGMKGTGATIIFDWDDTLFPTSYVTGEVLPSISGGETFPQLPKSSPFYKPLAELAHLVEYVLRAARALARVAIVTLSMSPWVPFSAIRYLPGLDIEELLLELDIPVYYSRGSYDRICQSINDSVKYWKVTLPSGPGSVGLKLRRLENDSYEVTGVGEQGLVATWNREHPADSICKGDVVFDVNGVNRSLEVEFRSCVLTGKSAVLQMGRQSSTIDPHKEAKRIDMAKCLKTFYGSLPNASWNVVSVGDSMAEHQALKEVLSEAEGTKCKTVHLLDKPKLDQLSNQLRVFLVWLPRILQHEKAFDLDMDRLGDLEKDLLARTQK